MTLIAGMGSWRETHFRLIFQGLKTGHIINPESCVDYIHTLHPCLGIPLPEWKRKSIWVFKDYFPMAASVCMNFSNSLVSDRRPSPCSLALNMVPLGTLPTQDHCLLRLVEKKGLERQKSVALSPPHPPLVSLTHTNTPTRTYTHCQPPNKPPHRVTHQSPFHTHAHTHTQTFTSIVIGLSKTE